MFLLLWNAKLLEAITEADFFDIGSSELHLPSGDDERSDSINVPDPPFKFFGVQHRVLFVS